MMRTAVRRLWGHASTGPTEDRDQSNARISAPISPLPSNTEPFHAGTCESGARGSISVATIFLAIGSTLRGSPNGPLPDQQPELVPIRCSGLRWAFHFLAGPLCAFSRLRIHDSIAAPTPCPHHPNRWRNMTLARTVGLSLRLLCFFPDGLLPRRLRYTSFQSDHKAPRPHLRSRRRPPHRRPPIHRIPLRRHRALRRDLQRARRHPLRRLRHLARPPHHPRSRNNPQTNRPNHV